MWMFFIWFYENDLYEIGISYIWDTVFGMQERKHEKVIRKSTPETCEKFSGVNLFITKRQAGF